MENWSREGAEINPKIMNRRLKREGMGFVIMHVSWRGMKEAGTDHEAQPSGALSNQHPNSTLTVHFPDN